MSQEVAILILAAGESKRLGFPKQLVRHKGKFLIEHILDIAANSNCTNINTILGANAKLILEKTSLKNTKIYVNQNWAYGMGASLSFGIQKIQESYAVDAILILLCDQLLVSTKHINDLISSYTKYNQIVASSYESTLGVPAIFPGKYFDDLMKLDKDKGAKQIIYDHLEEVIGIEYAKASVDIDTEKDILEEQ